MVNSAVFSPDGSRVVTASRDKTARLWDAKTGAALATLSGHTDVVNSAVFSPDGGRVVTGSHGQHRATVGRRDRRGCLQRSRGHAGAINKCGVQP